jgi:phosphoribosyl 1,2-cyclic phosphodiesterase
MLIDAGVGLRMLKRALIENGIDFQGILAIFVTHDHVDHIKAVSHLGGKYGIPIYTTAAVHEGIRKSRFAKETQFISRHYIEKDVPIEWKDFTLTAFEVPHDGTDNVGYYITCRNHHFTFATDVGHITETVAKYLRLGNHLIVEANYDEEMLQQGRYPYLLKQRIAGQEGHLSNRETAEFLAQNFDVHLKNIWLCHLSEDNNHPELACKTVEAALSRRNIKVGEDVNLMALGRRNPSKIFYFD